MFSSASAVDLSTRGYWMTVNASELRRAFETAIADYDFSALDRLLRQYPDLITYLEPESEESYLYRAVQEGKEQHLRLFLLHIENNPKYQNLIDSPNKGGLTPLALALLMHESKAMQLLIPKTDLLRTAGSQEATYLHLAIHYDNLEGIDSLLEKCPELLNKANNLGKVPLDFACRYGKIEAVRILLKRGADPFQGEESTGINALHTACFYGHSELISLLVERDSSLLECITEKGHSPLSIVCQCRHLENIKLLLSYGANPSIHLYKDKPLLFSIIDLGDFEILHLFIERNPSLVNMRGTFLQATPLWVACIQNQLEAARYLLERGAKIDQRIGLNSKATTPLSVASAKGWVPIVEMLLKQGARLDIKNAENKFILHLREYKVEVIECFLNWQLSRMTPLALLEQEMNEETFLLMIRWMSDQYVLNPIFKHVEEEQALQVSMGRLTQFIYCSLSSTHLHAKLEASLTESKATLEKSETKDELKRLIRNLRLMTNQLENIRFMAGSSLGTDLYAVSLKRKLAHAFFEFQKLLQSAKSKYTVLFQTLQQQESEFDSNGIFQLLAKLGVGFSAETTYEKQFGCKADHFYACGLLEGRDLRAIGISFTLFSLCENFKGSPDESAQIKDEIKRTAQKIHNFLSKQEDPSLRELLGEFEKLLERWEGVGIEVSKELYQKYCIEALKAFFQYNATFNQTLASSGSTSISAYLEENSTAELYLFVP